MTHHEYISIKDIIMDMFIERIDQFLEKKTSIVKEYINKCEKEKEELHGNVVQEARMTYDMNKFLKTVREFEAEQKKKSKKRVKDYDDI